MKFRVWDKKIPINNVPSSTVLENRLDLQNEPTVLLFEDEFGVVKNIELLASLRSFLKMGMAYSHEEVALKYIEYLETVSNGAPISEMDALKQKNAELEAAVLELTTMIAGGTTNV